MLKSLVGEALVIADDAPDDTWGEIRERYARGTPTTCPDCGGATHPKALQCGTRFFAHNPDTTRECALKNIVGESPEHVRLKTAIYRRARGLAGWTADVEVPTGTTDEDTGKPAIADVLALRTEGVGRDARRIFEVQLSHLDEGRLRMRHGVREAFASRVVWVTTARYDWANKVMWYQVSPATDQHPDLVVGGVVAFDGINYVEVDPFDADRMVPLILGARMPWVDHTGWIVDLAVTGEPKRRSSNKTISSRVAQWCDRVAAAPAALPRPRCKTCDRVLMVRESIQSERCVVCRHQGPYR